MTDRDAELPYDLPLHRGWARHSSREYCYQSLLALGFLWLLLGTTMVIAGCDISATVPGPLQLMIGVGTLLTLSGFCFVIFTGRKVRRLSAPRMVVMKAILLSVYLPHAVPYFREEAIGPNKFLKLTPEKLTNLGIVTSGDRAKIRKKCLYVVNDSEAQTVGELLSGMEQVEHRDFGDRYAALENILCDMGRANLLSRFMQEMVTVYEVQYLEEAEVQALGFSSLGDKVQLRQRCQDQIEGTDESTIYRSFNLQIEPILSSMGLEELDAYFTSNNIGPAEVIGLTDSEMISLGVLHPYNRTGLLDTCKRALTERCQSSGVSVTRTLTQESIELQTTDMNTSSRASTLPHFPANLVRNHMAERYSHNDAPPPAYPLVTSLLNKPYTNNTETGVRIYPDEAPPPYESLFVSNGETSV